MNRDFHRSAECVCYLTTKIALIGSNAGERKQKQRQIQQSTNERNRESTLFADHVELFLACSGGKFRTNPHHRDEYQYRVVIQHVMFISGRACYN
jgi:hypothetical protein